MNTFAVIGMVAIVGYVFLSLVDLIKFLIKHHKC